MNKNSRETRLLRQQLAGTTSNLVGHCLESASAGTDVLVKILLHFN